MVPSTRKSGTLFTCSDARKWPNMLSLFQLAFCLPFSNGRVEQLFSCFEGSEDRSENCIERHIE